MTRGVLWGLLLAKQEGLEGKALLRTVLVAHLAGASPAGLLVARELARRRVAPEAPPVVRPHAARRATGARAKKPPGRRVKPKV